MQDIAFNLSMTLGKLEETIFSVAILQDGGHICQNKYKKTLEEDWAWPDRNAGVSGTGCIRDNRECVDLSGLSGNRQRGSYRHF